jgi:hypothetical protein
MGLKWTLGKLVSGRGWSGFTWLRVVTVGGLLWMRWWTFGFWRHWGRYLHVLSSFPGGIIVLVRRHGRTERVQNKGPVFWWCFWCLVIFSSALRHKWGLLHQFIYDLVWSMLAVVRDLQIFKCILILCHICYVYYFNSIVSVPAVVFCISRFLELLWDRKAGMGTLKLVLNCLQICSM